MNAKIYSALTICVLLLSASAPVAADVDSANESRGLRLTQAEPEEGKTQAEASDDASVEEVLEKLEQVEASESGEYDEDEDDKFIPTQEVSSDQSLKFPVDI